MSYNLEFIQDLIDEGLLSSELAAEHYFGNASLIGEDNLELHNSYRAHRGCSVNQSSLAGWTWLIGSHHGDGLRPLLCATRRRDTCESRPSPTIGILGAYLIGVKLKIVLGCLFALANLFMLAVWSRCKAPAVQREVGIQLFVLRLFSAMGMVACLSVMVDALSEAVDRLQVLSVLHAALAALFINSSTAIVAICHQLKSSWSLLASIFLIEHSHTGQRVLLFASLRRAQVLLAAALLLCLPYSVIDFLTFGFQYCTHSGAAYLRTSRYMRLSFRHLLFASNALLHVLNVLDLLTFILLIVYAFKRFCACCRGSPSSQGQASGSVTYVLQQDVDKDTSEPSVLIEPGSSVPEGSALAEELKRLIFWQLVVTVFFNWLCFFLRFCDFHILRIATGLYVIAIVTKDSIRFVLLPVLAPMLSAAYRSGCASLLSEMRAAFMRLLRKLRGLSTKPAFQFDGEGQQPLSCD